MKDEDLTAPAGLGYAVSQSGNNRAVRGESSNDYDRRQARYTQSLNGDIWFSFLVCNDESTDVAGIDFRNQNSWAIVTNAPVVQLMGQMLFVGGNGGGAVDLSSKLSLSETVLVLGRLVVNTNAETLQVWVNPVFFVFHIAL